MADWQTDPRPFAALLPTWEAEHGWSAAEAARQLAVPYLTYRQWRDGRRTPVEGPLRKLMTLIDQAR